MANKIDKPNKPRIVPLPTNPRRVPPSLLPTKPPSKGGVMKYAKGGSTASKRGDGIATKGKTKGRFI